MALSAGSSQDSGSTRKMLVVCCVGEEGQLGRSSLWAGQGSVAGLLRQCSGAVIRAHGTKKEKKKNIPRSMPSLLRGAERLGPKPLGPHLLSYKYGVLRTCLRYYPVVFLARHFCYYNDPSVQLRRCSWIGRYLGTYIQQTGYRSWPRNNACRWAGRRP